MKRSQTKKIYHSPFLQTSAAILAGLLFVSAVQSFHPSGTRSPELAFTDPSMKGLAIVPASCPSDPHYEGECPVSNPIPSQCSISSSAWVITQGQSSTLSWAGPQGSYLGMPVTYLTGSITTLGGVPVTGSQAVRPQQTTTYVYQGTERYALFLTSSFYCDATITVLPADYCPAGQTLGSDGLCQGGLSCDPGQTLGSDGLCHVTACPAGQTLGSDGLCHSNACPVPFSYCGTGAAANNLYQRTYSSAPACAPLNALVSQCRFGCSSGSCNATPAEPSATLKVAPSLIQRGSTVQVTWSSVSVAPPAGRTAVAPLGTCTVTGSNGDSWSGLSGAQISSPIQSQTTYTLNCFPVAGGTITQTATVNIVPVFQEQ